MKKNARSFVVMLLCVLMALCLIGCGSKESGEKTDDAAGSGKTTGQESGGYTIEVDGVTLGVDMDMEKILEELGDPAEEPFEAPSCAGQGTAYIYDYGSYTIETYPKDDSNLVAFITLKDDTVSTAEGADLSMSKEEIVEIYGKVEVEDDQGLTYEKDGMKLKFIFEGDTMKSIEYASSVVG